MPNNPHRTSFGGGGGGAPTGAAGGDLAGTYPNPTLAAAPILKSIGTTKGDIIVFSSSATPVRLGSGADGLLLTADAASAGGVKWNAGAPPTGAAGGDLAGTYPNPTLAAAPLLKSLGTTKGDLISFSASGTPVRVAAGADGTAVFADSTKTPGTDFKVVNEIGLLAARPATGLWNGYEYTATDVNGGTTYRWNGSTYAQIAAGVLDTGGRELGYATSGANFSINSATPIDYTGLTTTVTVGTRPIDIEVEIPWINGGASSAIVYLFIVEGSTNLASVVKTIPNGNWDHMVCKVRLGGSTQPSAGSHTYKVQTQDSAGSATAYSNALQPGIVPFIQVTEV